jgi:integrase
LEGLLKYLDRTQVRELLKAARKESQRDYVMILTGYCHGLRASEICGLTTRNFADGFLTIQRLKGSLKTTQPLFESDDPILNEKQSISEWLKTVAKGEPLFGITRQHFHRQFQAHCKAAGIPKHLAHPHSLKHSVAMHTIKKAGVECVKQFLGHKSLSSTGAYLRVNDQEASAAVAAAL